MKLISWNVNGVRSALKRGLAEKIRKISPDVLCLQETKAPLEPLANPLPGYKPYWNTGLRPGYAGTAIFSKTAPWPSSPAWRQEARPEGRVQTAEIGFYLVNVYVPNSQRLLGRLAYRTKEWDVDSETPQASGEEKAGRLLWGPQRSPPGD